ncbi:hypothetical protein CPC08DRAFT_197664 [Agrocybe pediades]|nr:hypothetical protein CPC08DRAFT_197664 [Agrocybe pediades]
MSDNQEKQETQAVVQAEQPANEKIEAEVVAEVDAKESSPATNVEGTAQPEPSKNAPQPSRRPLTRSQTGTVPKRRTREESEVPTAEPKKRTPAPRKRQKTSATPSGDQAQNSSAASSPAPAPSREVSVAASVSSGAQPGQQAIPAAGNQITFYHTTSATSEDQPDQRLPRSRATLPTPIPNLTKKSRGRRVPTQDSQESPSSGDPDKKDERLYVCTVDGCGKCFHRGEHLKRHIRSIHTHEKPFKCTFPLCQKYFNRHDNLLQHLKVHRNPAEPKGKAGQKAGPEPRYASTSTASPPADPRERSYSPADEPDSPVAPINAPRTIYNSFPRTTYPVYPSMPTTTTFVPHTSSIHLLASMAVSSLRTELPQSPVDSRGSALRSSLY